MTSIARPARDHASRRTLRHHIQRVRTELGRYFSELHRLGVVIAANGVFVGFFVSVVVETWTDAGQVAGFILAVLAARIPEGRVWLLAVAAVASAWGAEGSTGATLMVASLIYLAVVLTPPQHRWLPVCTALTAAVAPWLSNGFGSFPLGQHAAGALLGLALGYLSRRAIEQRQHLRERTERSESHAMWLEQRTALARELHDVVGHHVTAMVIRAEAGQVSDPRTALTEIADLGRGALSELDAMVVHLRDPNAAASISAPPRLGDIDPVLTAPLLGQDIDVQVALEPDLPLDEVGELAAYRIVQEGLTNVLRHSGAHRVWVVVRRAGPYVRVSVLDDGRGPTAEPGAGLTGIGERVTSIGGVWEFGPRPEGGSQLDAFLPAAAVGGETP